MLAHTEEYTNECQVHTQLASSMHNAKVPHDDRCRDRIGELMAGDDDQRQVERVSGSEKLKSRVRKPERGGRSTTSSTTSSRACETNIADREVNRDRVAESEARKGKAKMLK